MTPVWSAHDSAKVHSLDTTSISFFLFHLIEGPDAAELCTANFKVPLWMKKP